MTDRLILATSCRLPSPWDPEGDPGPCDERRPELERILCAPDVSVKGLKPWQRNGCRPPGGPPPGWPNRQLCGLKGGNCQPRRKRSSSVSQIPGMTPRGEEL